MTDRPHEVMNTMRWFALVTLFLLIAAACGQLPGTHTEATRVQGDGSGGQEVIVEEGTEGRAGQVTRRSAGGSTGGGAGADGGTAGTAGGTTGARSGGGSRTAQGAGPGDTTGVSEDTLTIGIHAPLTGAAPVESGAFQEGKDLYWRWLHNDLGQTVHGRQIRVIFRDDQYSPSTAVAVCRQMASQAFLLIGGAGTDQIQACAQFAARNGIPYLSAGVTEVGLSDLEQYFAFTATYPAQGSIIAELIYRKLQDLDQYSEQGVPQPDGEVKVAFVRPDTRNFEDSEEGFRAGLEAIGEDLDHVATVPKADSPNLSSEISAAIRQMRDKGIDVVNIITAPVVTINFVQQAEGQAYRPRYVGPGITNGLNQVSNVLCGDKGAEAGFHRASFLSPWPGWPEVMEGNFDPDYRRAADKYASDDNTADSGGDIILAFWGFSRNLHQMFAEAGRDLDRQSFVGMLDSGFQAETGLTPPIQYAPGDHFGVDQVHRLEVDCTDALFHQQESFVSGY